ncbi:DNA polymerase III subunit gamma/tau [Thermincola potens]|uniref:DNA-directed DNA polymerase n=1 Tax=Thermincola potens (strain JR) TaxID=635013 RepID=D5X8W4_THEPJ|nr:DNA polymerase III subunit gamma/tau [Thermincola potens]ADG80964.1 DNA polymerase III, subunits gamma and tau [Thermincola potens JR]
MSYMALYREWRPQIFQDIVGQQHITRTLQNAIKANRIAHAYLFCGPRGTGKTTTAKVFAKALNCKEGPNAEPCNQCNNCIRITDGVSMDVLEIDAASNRGIDEIRDLREKVKFSPTEGRYRIYIIDEVHMLTTEAFNALLKTLEEPPHHVIFILATTEPHKIPTTILSRCQRFDFRRIGTGEIVDRLRDVCESLQVQTDEETLTLLAKTAEGGLRDALSVLDQCIAFGGQRVTVEEVNTVLGTVDQELLFKMVDYFINKDSTSALFLVDDIVNQGKDLRQFSKDMTEHLRNLLLIQVSDHAGELIAVTESTLQMLEEQAQKVSRNMILRLIDIFSLTEREVRWSNQPRLNLELAVIEACKAEPKYSFEDLAAKVEELEAIIRQGYVTPAIAVNPKKQPEKQPVDQKNSVKLAPKNDVPGNSLTLEALKNSWPEIMEKLKKAKRTAHAFLIEGNPVGLSGRRLIIAFPEDYAFHKENIEKPENREIIEKVIKDITGEEIRVKCKFLSETMSEENEEEENSLVETAIQLFGENVIEFSD